MAILWFHLEGHIFESKLSVNNIAIHFRGMRFVVEVTHTNDWMIRDLSLLNKKWVWKYDIES